MLFSQTSALPNWFRVIGATLLTVACAAAAAPSPADAAAKHSPVQSLSNEIRRSVLSGPPTVDPNVDDVVWQRYWTTTRHSLEVIAEEGGGFVIQDDLDGGLNRILNAMRL
jgi:hypothetical protein